MAPHLRIDPLLAEEHSLIQDSRDAIPARRHQLEGEAALFVGLEVVVIEGAAPQLDRGADRWRLPVFEPDDARDRAVLLEFDLVIRPDRPEGALDLPIAGVLERVVGIDLIRTMQSVDLEVSVAIGLGVAEVWRHRHHSPLLHHFDVTVGDRRLHALDIPLVVAHEGAAADLAAQQADRDVVGVARETNFGKGDATAGAFHGMDAVDAGLEVGDVETPVFVGTGFVVPVGGQITAGEVDGGAFDDLAVGIAHRAVEPTLDLELVFEVQVGALGHPCGNRGEYLDDLVGLEVRRLDPTSAGKDVFERVVPLVVGDGVERRAFGPHDRSSHRHHRTVDEAMTHEAFDRAAVVAQLQLDVFHLVRIELEEELGAAPAGGAVEGFDLCHAGGYDAEIEESIGVRTRDVHSRTIHIECDVCVQLGLAGCEIRGAPRETRRGRVWPSEHDQVAFHLRARGRHLDGLEDPVTSVVLRPQSDGADRHLGHAVVARVVDPSSAAGVEDRVVGEDLEPARHRAVVVEHPTADDATTHHDDIQLLGRAHETDLPHRRALVRADGGGRLQLEAGGTVGLAHIVEFESAFSVGAHGGCPVFAALDGQALDTAAVPLPQPNLGIGKRLTVGIDDLPLHPDARLIDGEYHRHGLPHQPPAQHVLDIRNRQEVFRWIDQRTDRVVEDHPHHPWVEQSLEGIVDIDLTRRIATDVLLDGGDATVGDLARDGETSRVPRHDALEIDLGAEEHFDHVSRGVDDMVLDRRDDLEGTRQESRGQSGQRAVCRAVAVVVDLEHQAFLDRIEIDPGLRPGAESHRRPREHLHGAIVEGRQQDLEAEAAPMVAAHDRPVSAFLRRRRHRHDAVIQRVEVDERQLPGGGTVVTLFAAGAALHLEANASSVGGDELRVQVAGERRDALEGLDGGFLGEYLRQLDGHGEAAIRTPAHSIPLPGFVAAAEPFCCQHRQGIEFVVAEGEMARGLHQLVDPFVDRLAGDARRLGRHAWRRRGQAMTQPQEADGLGPERRRQLVDDLRHRQAQGRERHAVRDADVEIEARLQRATGLRRGGDDTAGELRHQREFHGRRFAWEERADTLRWPLPFGELHAGQS